MPINPDWTEEEIILAYDLYLREGRRSLSKKNADVATLSEYLRHLPWHYDKWQDGSFRNIEGVVNKLNQIKEYETDKKPHSINKAVQRVVLKYRHHPEEVHRLAQAIRDNVTAQLEMLTDSDPLPLPAVQEAGAEAYAEGQARFATHKRLERSRALVNRKLATVKAATGKLACEVCSFDFEATYGDIGKGFAECHHLTPLSELGETETKLNDLAVVCANCHRVLHRCTGSGKLLTLDELRARLQHR